MERFMELSRFYPLPPGLGPADSPERLGTEPQEVLLQIDPKPGDDIPDRPLRVIGIWSDRHGARTSVCALASLRAKCVKRADVQGVDDGAVETERAEELSEVRQCYSMVAARDDSVVLVESNTNRWLSAAEFASYISCISHDEEVVGAAPPTACSTARSLRQDQACAVLKELLNFGMRQHEEGADTVVLCRRRDMASPHRARECGDREM
jgi:hypothetical protein